MKKSIKIGIGVLFIIGAIGSCFNGGDKKQNEPAPPQ